MTAGRISLCNCSINSVYVAQNGAKFKVVSLNCFGAAGEQEQKAIKEILVSGVSS